MRNVVLVFGLTALHACTDRQGDNTQRTQTPSASPIDQTAPASPVERFLRAVATRDYRAIFEGSDGHQRLLENKKRVTPESMWASVTADFYRDAQLGLESFEAKPPTVITLPGDVTATIFPLWQLLGFPHVLGTPESRTDQAFNPASGVSIAT